MSRHTERIRQIRTRTLLSTTCTARSTGIQLQVSMRRTRNCVASEPESESIFPPTFTSPALQPRYRGTTRQRLPPSVVCESRPVCPRGEPTNSRRVCRSITSTIWTHPPVLTFLTTAVGGESLSNKIAWADDGLQSKGIAQFIRLCNW